MSNHNQYQQAFDQLSQQSFVEALDWFYHQQVKDNFIDPEKLSINTLYTQHSETYDINFQILINRVRDAYASKVVSNDNAKKAWVCPLCVENIDKIGQHQKQYIDLTVNQTDYVLSLTPFPSFKKHLVLSAKQHRPMNIDIEAVKDLLTLQSQLGSNYSIVSNSDHVKTGASILAHHHYQIIADAKFPLADAKTSQALSSLNEAVSIEQLHFPATVIKLSSSHIEALIAESQAFLNQWLQQSKDHRCNIWVRQENNIYEIYFILRTTQLETDPSLHRYKTEGIGIIEMCGYGIFPTPKTDTDIILKEIEDNADQLMIQLLQSHAPKLV